MPNVEIFTQPERRSVPAVETSEQAVDWIQHEYADADRLGRTWYRDGAVVAYFVEYTYSSHYDYEQEN